MKVPDLQILKISSTSKTCDTSDITLFKHAIFRSPDEITDLSPVEGVMKTAIHFLKHDVPNQAKKIEKNGQSKGLSTGAFLVARWVKPAQV